VRGGDVLEVMRFVDDHARAGREHRVLGVVADLRAQRQVGEQQMMIGDQDVGGRRRAPRFIEEAARVVRAAGAQAVVALRHDLLPHLGARTHRQIGEAAVLRLLAPRQYLLQLLQQLVLDQLRALRLDLGGLAAAEIVAASLDQRGAAGQPGALDQQRQILAEELLLQVDGVRRDDHAALVGQAPQDGGHQIGERFAGPGTGLDAQHLVVVEGIADRPEHGELLRPVLVADQRRPDGAAGEQIGGRGAVELRARRHLQRLDDDVDLRDLAVDEVGADAVVAECRRDAEVGIRRHQPAARMVVDHHLAGARHVHDGRNGAAVATRQDAHVADQGAAQGAEHEHLVPAGVDDGGAQRRRRAVGEALARRRHDAGSSRFRFAGGQRWGAPSAPRMGWGRGARPPSHRLSRRSTAV
jgi:hypothetical protein